MQEDYNKLLELLNEDRLEEIYLSIGVDFDEIDGDIELLKYRDVVHDKYFSFLDKYFDNDEFFSLLNNIPFDQLLFLRYATNNEFFYKMTSSYLKNAGKDNIDILIIDNDDLMFYLDNGFSINEIINSNSVSLDMQYQIYVDYPELRDEILNSYSFNKNYKIVVAELVLGNEQYLSEFLNYLRDIEKNLKLLLEELTRYKDYDFNFVFESIINCVTGPSNKVNISVIDDDNIVKKLLADGDSRALIFSKNPSEDLVASVDFSFNDYTIYEGSYRNSSALLLKFLRKGKFDALMYAGGKALNDEVCQIIEENNYSLDNLASFKNLYNSVEVYSFLAKHNNYRPVFVSDEIFSDLDIFNFVYQSYIDKKFMYQFSFGNSNAYNLFMGIFADSWADFFPYDHINVNLDVARRLVDLGLDVKKFIEHLSNLDNRDIFIRAFVEKEIYEPLFVSTDYRLVNNHLDKLSYEMYSSFVDTYHVKVNNFSICCKLFKEGHYDVLKDYSDTLYDYRLIELGLDNLTYEEYLKYPDYVREIPVLKEKYLSIDADSIRKMLDESPSPYVLEKAALNGFSFDELLPYISRDSAISDNLVLHYLNMGEKRIIDYISNYIDYNQNGKGEQIVDKYFALLNGQLPNENFMNNASLGSIMFKKYLDNNKFDILNVNFKLIDKMLDALINSSYNLDVFKIYPVFSYRVINKLKNDNNIHELFDIIINSNDKNIFNAYDDCEKILILFYREQIESDLLNKYSETFGISLEYLVKNLKQDEYGLFNIIKFNVSSINNIYLAKILNNLNVDKVRDILEHSYIDSNNKALIIRKMVERGYYDFISYYNDRIEEDVIKRALFGGYFPENELKNNLYFKTFISKINFTDEEKAYLKTKIDSDSRYIYFFPEIINDKNKLASYIISDPSIVNILNEEQRNDINLLAVLVESNPELCPKVFTTKIDSEILISLCLKNISLIDYLPSSYINLSFVKGLVDKYPNIINYYDGDLDNSIIETALTNGYEITSSSPISVILFALLHEMNISKDILINFPVKDLIVCYNSCFEKNMETSVSLLDEVFKDIYNSSKYDFIYDCFFTCRINYYKYDFINKIFEKLGIDFSLYYNLDVSDKDTFILRAKLNEIPCDEEHLSNILSLVSDVKSAKIILPWINTNFSNDLIDDISHDIAKKYLAEDPMYFIEYVDVTDRDVIKICKDNILKYPELYMYVPSILDSEELIKQLITLTKGAVFTKIDDKFKYNLDILELVLSYNFNLFYYVDLDNPIIIEFGRKHLYDSEFVYKSFPSLIENREVALKLLELFGTDIFYSLPDNLKNDKELISRIVEISPGLILSVNREMVGYRDILLIALEKQGYLINSFIGVMPLDDEMIKVAAKTYPRVIFEIPDEFFTAELIAQINDYGNITLNDTDYDRVLKLIHFPTFDINNKENCSVFANYLLRYYNSARASIKDDERFSKVLAKGIMVGDEIKRNNGLFGRLVSFLPVLNIESFDLDFQQVLKDGYDIITSTGKINTFEKNPIFSYDVVKYVYPLFGKEFVLELIKFNTKAAKMIINQIKDKNGILVKEYYKFICENNVLNDDDKRVHYAFRSFDKIENLIKDILNSNIKLTEEDINNLRKIILGSNMYNISSCSDLKNYDEITQKYLKEKSNSSDINEIKNILSSIFGYKGIEELSRDFNNFQLNNFVNFKEVRNDLRKQYGIEEAERIWNECFYTKKDTYLVILMDRIINSNNINELKELMQSLITDRNGALDYCDDVVEIIRKVRLLYNYQFNGRLTKVDNIKSKKMLKDDPDNPYGVTIIEMDSEPFYFLAHRIYSYDISMSGFKQRLLADPSLWTKLEGASTLSTSSFSDKGFWFLNNTDSSGVVYLFNNLPSNFLLFMYGRDLYVEHGGYKLEPTANNNSFTNLEALNQTSCYHHCAYNEVAGFRDGMLPCAFACVGDTPNEETIRAAKYFSEFLHVDIPIIKFNIPAYDNKKQEDYQKALENFKNNPNYQAMKGIFFDGIKISDGGMGVTDKVKMCLDTLKEKYNKGEISIEYLIKSLVEMENLVNQITVGLPDHRKEIKRIAVFRKTLSIFSNLSREEIVRLENAEMGESGIMYKFEDDGEKFLVKPSVEKKNFRTQSFRADIQEAAYTLQNFLSPDTAVKVESLGTGKLKLAKQELINVSSTKSKLLEDWVNNGGNLDYKYSSALLREYVVDFLLCNFDCYVGNFIIDSDDNVRGIDKEQSFRFMNEQESLNADFSYTPNGTHRIPIYQILFQRYLDGSIDLDFSVVSDTIEKVKLLSDEDYKNMFRKYAESLDKYRKDEILEAILKRRDVAIQNMEKYIQEIQEKREEENKSL